MANMRIVNREIKRQFPNLDVEAIRGYRYVYFIGDDGFDKVESVMAHPVSTNTIDLTRLCLDAIKDGRDE